MFRYIFAAIFALIPILASEQPQIVVIHDQPEKNLRQILSVPDGYQLTSLNATETKKIAQLKPEIVILTGEPSLSESEHIKTYLENQGKLIVLAQDGIHGKPSTFQNSVTLSLRVENKKASIKTRLLSKEEEPQVSQTTAVSSLSQKPGIAIQTNRIGLADIALSLPLQGMQSSTRNILSFEALGQPGTDILSLSIIDHKKRRWVSFVELLDHWKTYRVRFADFMPTGSGVKADEQLSPEHAAQVEFELVSRVLWPELPGGFSLADVQLGEGGELANWRSQDVLLWKSQLKARHAQLPTGFLNPLHHAHPFTTKSGTEMWSISQDPHYIGRDSTKGFGMLYTPDYQQRLLASKNDQKGRAHIVGAIRSYLGGHYRQAQLAMLGFTYQDLIADKELQGLLTECIDHITQPRLIGATPILHKENSDGFPLAIRVHIDHPGASIFSGKLNIRLGDGRVHGEKVISLKSSTHKFFDVPLIEIPQDFPFTQFRWTIELSSHGKLRDSLSDSVNIQDTLNAAAHYLLAQQAWHGDGRFSHHYFTDQYSARFLFALAQQLEDENRNAPGESKWSVTANQCRTAALNFADMICKRQDPDGSFPMGYMEHKRNRYVADLGQVSMGLVQIASGLDPDNPKRKKYLQTIHRYQKFRQSFYQDKSQIAKLEKQFGHDSKGVQLGYYGLGLLNSDYYTGKSWHRRQREERGPWWVGPVSMGFLGGMAKLSGDSTYLEILKRDTENFLMSRRPLTGVAYFTAESLFWAYDSIEDTAQRQAIQGYLTQQLPPLYFTKHKTPYFGKQAREALWPLMALYQRERFSDSASLRAVILAGLWFINSNHSSQSLSNVAGHYPRAQYGTSLAAYRYISFSAFWMLELMQPGCTTMTDAQ